MLPATHWTSRRELVSMWWGPDVDRDQPSGMDAWCGTLIATVLVAVAIALADPASASAARLYVAVGDSVGAGLGATSSHSSFDLYCAYLKSAAGGSLVDQCVNESVVGLT